jgi:putative SOS response-associated peptidase YedK
VCNLYSLNKNKESVAKMFGVGHNRTVDVPLFPGIFPNYVAPVVRQAADGDRELVNMNWGFVLPQPGKVPRRVTNVRDDKAMSGFWQESMEKRRGLVPASAFCEPHDAETFTPKRLQQPFGERLTCSDGIATAEDIAKAQRFILAQLVSDGDDERLAHTAISSRSRRRQRRAPRYRQASGWAFP